MPREDEWKNQYSPFALNISKKSSSKNMWKTLGKTYVKSFSSHFLGILVYYYGVNKTNNHVINKEKLNKIKYTLIWRYSAINLRTQIKEQI